MGYSRLDGIDSANVPMAGDAVTVKAAISTSTANLKLAPGIYKVSVRNGDPTCDVYLALGVDNTITAAEPADTANQGDASGASAGTLSFRGDEIERIRVDAGKPFVAFILSSGGSTTKIKFVRVV